MSAFRPEDPQRLVVRYLARAMDGGGDLLREGKQSVYQNIYEIFLWFLYICYVALSVVHGWELCR